MLFFIWNNMASLLFRNFIVPQTHYKRIPNTWQPIFNIRTFSHSSDAFRSLCGSCVFDIKNVCTYERRLKGDFRCFVSDFMTVLWVFCEQVTNTFYVVIVKKWIVPNSLTSLIDEDNWMLNGGAAVRSDYKRWEMCSNGWEIKNNRFYWRKVHCVAFRSSNFSRCTYFRGLNVKYHQNLSFLEVSTPISIKNVFVFLWIYMPEMTGSHLTNQPQHSKQSTADVLKMQDN